MKKGIRNYLYIFSIIFGSLIVVILVFWWFFPQIFIYLCTIYWNYSPEDTPYAYIVPKSEFSIGMLPTDDSNLRKIECGPISIYLKDAKKAEIRRFKDNSIFIVQPRKWLVSVSTNIPDLINSLRNDPEFDFERYSNVFGQEMFSSLFDFHRSVYETTPNSVSIRSSVNDVIRATVFLILKGVLIPFDVHGGFIIEVGNIKGIQVGDPSQGDNRICINLYPNSTTHYQIVFSGFDQEKINETLARVRLHSS